MESNEESLWDTKNKNNNHIIGIQKKKQKGAESLLKEIMAENFQNLRKYTDIQLHEAQRFPISFNPKTFPRYIITDCQQSQT